MEKHNRSTGTYPFLPTDIMPNVACPYAGQAKKPREFRNFCKLQHTKGEHSKRKTLKNLPYPLHNTIFRRTFASQLRK